MKGCEQPVWLESCEAKEHEPVPSVVTSIVTKREESTTAQRLKEGNKMG